MAEAAWNYPLHTSFDYKVRNFPERIYDFNPNNHITKLLKTLLGDAGVGQMAKSQTVARLNEVLGGTQFSDLDYLFGRFMGMQRMPEEKYDWDPFSDQLTETQWRDVLYRDAQYRERITLYLQAMLRGGTNEGLAMAAEAACGHPCVVLEMYRNVENLGLSNDDVGIQRLPTGTREVCIVPRAPSLSPSAERAIYLMTDKLAPENSVITVDASGGWTVRTSLQARYAASPSEFFHTTRMVTGSNVPTVDVLDATDVPFLWMEEGVEVEAPTFAHLSTQEDKHSHSYAVTSVTFSEISIDGVRRQQFPGSNILPRSWGPWRVIERADSPDNYPLGKYAGDASRLDQLGHYIFPWGSQSDFEVWLRASVEAQGGEFGDGRYRLPTDTEIIPGETSVPADALASGVVRVQTTYYAR